MSCTKCKRQNAHLKIMQTKITTKHTDEKGWHCTFKIQDRWKPNAHAYYFCLPRNMDAKSKARRRGSCYTFLLSHPFNMKERAEFSNWTSAPGLVSTTESNTLQHQPCHRRGPSRHLFPAKRAAAAHVPLRSRKPMGLQTDYSAIFCRPISLSEIDFFI